MASVNSNKRAANDSALRIIRRFSSIKVDFEKEKRKTLSRYQQKGLRVSISIPKVFHDKKEIRKRLKVSVERYSLPELYVKMLCALFPGMNSRESPDSNALVKHLKLVFRLNDAEHAQLMEIARMTKLPQRIVNLEIVEAKNLPGKDTNGLSDPFCVVFVNEKDLAQRTKVVPNNLAPVWHEYFTFKVNDPAKDVLILEVMDYNEEDETLRSRLGKFRDVKSRSTFGILLKEIVSARSMQELIGSLRIPVSEISSETLEKWFKLKNHENRGEIYLRMALGYNKSKDTATEEFLQITHFLLVHELDKDASLGTPFYWDEHYEMWSKYILRQFKWQGGLKPKDIVLAKWKAYTLVNYIYPLNPNMLCLLLDSVLERVMNSEYDLREVSRFWDSTQLLLNTIFTFLLEIHDVLPCPVTVLHTYHMLKTLELLNQFLEQPQSPSFGTVPFTKPGIIDSVVKAIRDGAEKFYVKVFSDSTFESESPDQDALLVALERLLKMGQILHEDLRLGLHTINNDFKGILNIDYMRITYQVYDEQYGKMVKYIVEEYSSNLLDPLDADNENGDIMMDENSAPVKSGLVVFKLYLAVKNLAELAPRGYTNENLSEFSMSKGFHSWFFHSVATWIDILRNQTIKWVKSSVDIEGSKTISNDTVDSKLSKSEKHGTKEVPISSSAVDTAQMFLQIQKFWTSLGWQDPKQSYLIIRKVLEELYGYLIYYAAELRDAILRSEPSEQATQDDVNSYVHKACTSINNINYVQEQVEVLEQQLNISDIIHKINQLKRMSESEDYEAEIESLKVEMEKQVEGVTQKIIKSIVKTVLPEQRRLLKELSTDMRRRSTPNKRLSANRFQHLINYIDSCLIILNSNLENKNFNQMLCHLWNGTVDCIQLWVRTGLEMGKSSDYFQRWNDLMYHLFNLFWPRDLELQTRIDDPDIFDSYEELKTQLTDLELPLVELKVMYYGKRHQRQQVTPVSCNEHGIITIRAGICESQSSVVVEILNARNLKSYDSNDLSDPYVIVSLAPNEYFPTASTFTTTCQKETLFPLFDEKFTIIVGKDDLDKSGFLMLTMYDYDLIGRDDFMGEVFIPLSNLKKLESPNELASLPQINLVIGKPTVNDEEVLQKFDVRTWDKDAVKFTRAERDKIE